MNVRYALKWLRYQHFWRFVYRPVKPYDTGIYLYFGLPRSGKSTYAAKLAKKALTAGRAVYSNFPIRGTFQITTIFFLHALTEQAGQQTHRDTDQRHGDNTQHQQIGTDNGIGQTDDGNSGITGADGAAGDHSHDTGEKRGDLSDQSSHSENSFRCS